MEFSSEESSRSYEKQGRDNRLAIAVDRKHQITRTILSFCEVILEIAYMKCAYVSYVNCELNVEEIEEKVGKV